jgi:hypothetical protein
MNKFLPSSKIKTELKAFIAENLKCTGECPCRKYTASAKSADA